MDGEGVFDDCSFSANCHSKVNLGGCTMMERVRYDLKRRGKGKKKGKGRGVGCRRGCGVIIPRSLHFSTASVPQLH